VGARRDRRAGEGERVKLLFVDFDGVLNHLAWVKQPRPRAPFDPACLWRLGQICERTGASIVVSSSWRTPIRNGRLSWLRGLLAGAGLGARGHVVGMTPDHRYRGPRADEIRAYMAKRPADRFAILDDDADAGEGLAQHFVQTDFERGLLDEHVEAAIRILGAGPDGAVRGPRIRFTEPADAPCAAERAS
jgi:hypothetical protein